MIDVTYKTIDNKDINAKWCEENYNLFNFLMFEGKLPAIDFELVNYKNKSWYGLAKKGMPNSRHSISLNFQYDQMEIEWKCVLIHEMIHIWQFVNSFRGGHGKSFKRKAMEIFNDFGYDIKTTRDYGLK